MFNLDRIAIVCYRFSLSVWKEWVRLVLRSEEASGLRRVAQAHYKLEKVDEGL